MLEFTLCIICLTLIIFWFSFNRLKQMDKTHSDDVPTIPDKHKRYDDWGKEIEDD